MKLIVSYKSPFTPVDDRQVLMTIELPAEIADDIATNVNTQLHHMFMVELAVTRVIGTVTAPVGGLR